MRNPAGNGSTQSPTVGSGLLSPDDSLEKTYLATQESNCSNARKHRVTVILRLKAEQFT